MLTTGNVFEAFGMAFLAGTLRVGIPEVKKLVTGADTESRSRQIYSYLFQYVLLTLSQMPRLICGKTGICTTSSNPWKRVISIAHIRWRKWKIFKIFLSIS